MSPQEIDNLIDTFIIDNNIMAIDPAKMRAVLKAINEATQITDIQAVNVYPPLSFDQFQNTLVILPIAYQKISLVAKGPTGINVLLVEPGDIVQGWSPDGKSWWDSAVYNGGSFSSEGSYTVLVGTQVIA